MTCRVSFLPSWYDYEEGKICINGGDTEKKKSQEIEVCVIVGWFWDEHNKIVEMMATAKEMVRRRRW